MDETHTEDDLTQDQTESMMVCVSLKTNLVAALEIWSSS